MTVSLVFFCTKPSFFSVVFAARAQEEDDDDEVVVKLGGGYAANRAAASHSWFRTSSEKRSTSEAIEMNVYLEAEIDFDGSEIEKDVKTFINRVTLLLSVGSVLCHSVSEKPNIKQWFLLSRLAADFSLFIYIYI